MTPQQQKVYDFIKYHPNVNVFDIANGTGFRKDKVECRLTELLDQSLVKSQVLFAQKLSRSVKHWRTT